MFNPFDLMFRIWALIQSFTMSAWRVLNWSFEVDVSAVLPLPAITLSVWALLGGVGLIVIVGSTIIKLIPGL